MRNQFQHPRLTCSRFRLTKPDYPLHVPFLETKNRNVKNFTITTSTKISSRIQQKIKYMGYLTWKKMNTQQIPGFNLDSVISVT